MEKNMEKTIIDLIKLNFDLNDFYSITIHPNHYEETTLLQGSPCSEKLLKYTKLGFVFKSGDTDDRLIAIKDKVRITLY